MCHNGVVVDTQRSGIVSGRGRYDFLDMVNLLWKKQWEERQNVSFCYYRCLDRSSCRRVSGGGLGQKVIFRPGWNLIYCVLGLTQGCGEQVFIFYHWARIMIVQRLLSFNAAVGDRIPEGEIWDRLFSSDCETSVENQWGEGRARKPNLLIL